MKNIEININSKEEFIGFMESLRDDFEENSSRWQNKNLSDYLLAIQSWTEDMEGFYINNKIDLPPNINWTVFAKILIAATMYE